MHLLSNRSDLSLELLSEGTPKSVCILSKLLDTLVQLVPCHLILKEFPAELGLVVDVRDLRDRICLGRCLCIELLRDRLGRILEFFKKSRCDPVMILRRKKQKDAYVTHVKKSTPAKDLISPTLIFIILDK